VQRPTWLEEIVQNDHDHIDYIFFTPHGTECSPSDDAKQFFEGGFLATSDADLTGTSECPETSPSSNFAIPPCHLSFQRFTSALSTPEEEDEEENTYRSTDLDHFYDEARFDYLLSAGHFAKVGTLQECSNGSGIVELHRWSELCSADIDQSKVVVKRMPLNRLNGNAGLERDERTVHRLGCYRSMEDMLTEIGIYSYLSRQPVVCPYLLRMHAAFQVENDAWLVLQHAEGGDLFNRITERPLSSDQILCWFQQLLQAVEFMHRHQIGHRDISIENILLHKERVQLMDFGQAVQTHSTNSIPLRYFRGVGKSYCRALECRIPVETLVRVVVPESLDPSKIAFVKTQEPEDYMCEVRLPIVAAASEECLAEPCGYRVPPADVFACGVCAFVMIAQMPPWRETVLSDPHFAYVHKNGIATLLKAWKLESQPAVDDLLKAMLQANPAARPIAADCLAHAMFASVNLQP
jgi:serine/threonine protein kinase